MNLTIAESFICPVCGNEHTALQGSSILFSDTRLDFFNCNTCGTSWRVYSKVAEAQIEVINQGTSEEALNEELVEEDAEKLEVSDQEK